MAQSVDVGAFVTGSERGSVPSFFGDAAKDAFWATLSPTEREDLIAEEEALVARARTDMATFFQYVMREQTTREPIEVLPHQAVGLGFMLAHDRSVNMWPVGHSKCHGRGTPILMADGSIRPVEEVRVGDFVMGPGGPKRVTHANGGYGKLFRIIPTKGGDPFVVNEDHILTLVPTPQKRRKGNGVRVFEQDPPIDISVRDFLGKSDWFQVEHKLFRVPVSRFVGEEPIGVDPYFLGVWFGDGLHSVRHGVRLTSADEEIREYCRSVGESYGLEFREKQTIDFALVLPGGKGRGLPKRGPNPLMVAIREIVGEGLSMDRLRTAPREQRLAFLAGFLDADGSTRDNCVSVTQKRKDWLDTIVFIARSLGIQASVGTIEVPDYGTYHRACLYGDVEQIPFLLPRRRCSARKQKKRAERTGFRIEPLGDGDFFGFTIGGDGRYLLGDFTVTHNTFCTAALTLFLLGNDPTLRGAIVSATQEQSKKILAVVADYILHSHELHRVFPNLRKSPRLRDPWTQTSITVERPPGIPDASLFAVGIDGGLPGARLNWIVVDDILNRENTATKEGRDKVYTWFDSTVLSRLDPVGARVIVTNTTWHPDDLVHRLEKLGWPSLRMDVLGNLKVQDDAQWMAEGKEPWTHPELRPASPSPYEENYRLRSHDPDATNEKTLWPEKFSKHYVDKVLRFRHLPSEFNRAYMNLCRDDGTSMCKQEFIDLCKRKAREEGVYGLVSVYRGPNPTFTGLDLAVSPGEENDDTAFFTFEVRPDGIRVILDIEVGQWDGPTIIKKLFRKHLDYNSIIRVENNGAQDYIRQFALQTDRSLPVKAHTTGRAKAHPEHGVPGLFLEFSNSAWLIPNTKRGECSEPVQKFIDSCLYYSPSRHTDDVLMAAYFAREQAKEWGLLIPDPDRGGTGGNSVQASVMAR